MKIAGLSDRYPVTGKELVQKSQIRLRAGTKSFGSARWHAFHGDTWKRPRGPDQKVLRKAN